MVALAKKAVDRTSRQENRAQYAPKKDRFVKPQKDSAEIIALKKITSRVLESLKNPSAIPSQVIMDALLQARSVK